MRAFFLIAFVHLLAVASPGPDFAIVVKQSITQSRRVMLWTILGISSAVLLHVAYSLLGIGFLIAQSIVLFTSIKLIGAAYLLFIGWKSLMAKKQIEEVGEVDSQRPSTGAFQAFKIGFLCNALNPKATLFFLALFTQVIEPATPLTVQIGYGAYMAVQTFAWFALLGSILSLRVIRHHIDAFHHWAERMMGVVLIALGLKVALSVRD